MAVTQYIGARYVPIFYTASDDSNSWEAGVQYEPLTIVTYLNQSYTSKIPVPASVGNPADNPTYWVMTGAYNAQVDQYRQDVSTYNSRISSLEAFEDYAENISYYKGKKIVVYGDSSGTSADNFVDKLASSYGLDITNRCVGGSSLSESHGGIDAGVTTISAAADLDNFDIAFIVYGINDWQNSCFMDNWVNAIDTVCTKFAGSTCEPIFIFPWYCYRLFTVFVDENGTSLANRMGISLTVYIDHAIDHLAHYGAKYINLYTASDVNDLNYTTWLVNNSGIYVHATAALSEKVCRLVMSNLMNNGKTCTYISDNIAGMLYNNIAPVNGQLATEGYTLIFRKATASNLITCEPLDPDEDTIYYIRGFARGNAGYEKLIVQFGTTVEQTYTIVSGSQFEIVTHGKGNSFGVRSEFFTNSATFCYLYDLEIYATQPHKSKHFNLTLHANAAAPTDYPAPTVYVEDGFIKFDPIELVFSGSGAAYAGLAQSPLQLPSNAATRGIKIGTAPNMTAFDVVNRGRFLISDTSFSASDHIAFTFPPIKIAGSAPGYTP